MEKAYFKPLDLPGRVVAVQTRFNIICAFGVTNNTSFDLAKTQLQLRVSHQNNIPCSGNGPLLIYQIQVCEGAGLKINHWKGQSTHNNQLATYELTELQFSTACVGHTWRLAFSIKAWNMFEKQWHERTWIMPTDIQVISGAGPQRMETNLSHARFVGEGYRLKVEELSKAKKSLENKMATLEKILEAEKIKADNAIKTLEGIEHSPSVKLTPEEEEKQALAALDKALAEQDGWRGSAPRMTTSSRETYLKPPGVVAVKRRAACDPESALGIVAKRARTARGSRIYGNKEIAM